jgi:DNA-binding CsgD family transcriptional regulator
VGVVVVDDNRIVLANQAARALLDEGHILRLVDGRIHAATPEADAKLAAAVRDVRDNEGDKPVAIGLEVGANDQVRALIRPLRSPSAAMLGVDHEAIALYLSDPRKTIETPEEILQQMFGLTTREAAVLRALVQGDDLNTIAKRLGIGLQTVKTHIQHIMRTTGANRQAELVTLVLSSPAWISAQGPAKRH